MTAVNNLIWGPISGPNITKGSTFTSLNDADNSLALRFYAHKTGIINKIFFHIGAIAGNPPPYYIGLVTVDSSGAPTSTPAGGSAIEQVDFTTDGFKEITLQTPANVIAGTLYAARIWPNGVPDVSNLIRLSAAASNFKRTLPSLSLYTISWGHDVTQDQGIGVAYNDGDLISPSILSSGLTFKSDSDPNEIGCKFSLPFNATAIAFLLYANIPAAQEPQIRLYDSNNNILRSKTVDISLYANSSLDRLEKYFFSSPVNLTKDSIYRLIIVPTTTTVMTYFDYSFYNASHKNFFAEGSRWSKTSRNGGVWTDSETELLPMGLILTDISQPEVPAVNNFRLNRPPLIVGRF